ncbi:hypothetical protein LTR47_011781 [Exophiala xenobiotica]|nr:hypothetical protein LTR92_011475 [Exophiala xenobiotica]KAK5218123.1 hypothetical protein LTR47_011781 [Exophiala xenobiotica]KAK5243273.1 hypothetical protein LTS06_010929 [Exophiala xenobiotica]KAK5358367.1 hypothetical protein LTS13_010918 [Exophiala xenobiotica]KAK5394035.1 hypothetical protein LTR79_008248 [Exophiala xenobiotica]
MLPSDANEARKEIEKCFTIDNPMSAFSVTMIPVAQMPGHLEGYANNSCAVFIPPLEVRTVKEDEMAAIHNIAKDFGKKPGLDSADDHDGDRMNIDADDSDGDDVKEEGDYLVHTSKFAVLFHRVIGDEGHKGVNTSPTYASAWSQRSHPMVRGR